MIAYITTFDAVFFTAAALYIASLFIPAKFSAALMKFSINNPFAAITLSIALTGLSIALYVYFSVQGTTTAMFWGAVIGLVFNKQLNKLQKKRDTAAFAVVFENQTNAIARKASA